MQKKDPPTSAIQRFPRRVGWVVTVLVLTVLAVLVHTRFSPDKASAPIGGEAQTLTLEQSADQMNAKLPMMIDAATRLDSTEARAREFHYNYTLMNADAASDPGGTQLNARLAPHLKKTVCGNPQMRTFLSPDVTAVYNYHAEDGSVLTSVRVSLSDCVDS